RRRAPCLPPGYGARDGARCRRPVRAGAGRLRHLQRAAVPDAALRRYARMVAGCNWLAGWLVGGWWLAGAWWDREGIRTTIHNRAPTIQPPTIHQPATHHPPA